MTVIAQCYATVDELIRGLGLNGDQPGLLGHVRTASRQFYDLEGNFIPILQTRRFYQNHYGPRFRERRYNSDPYRLGIDPLISARAVSNNGTAVSASDYWLDPVNRHWPNGPYTRIESTSVMWSELGVDITGYWGKYEEIRKLSLSGVTQTDSATTLTVSDGSRVSPGMVLKIGDEQEMILAGNGGEDSPAATAATSVLTGAITVEEEEVGVTNGGEFKRGETIQVGTEDLHIERIAGNVLVCKRGWNGTTKAAHALNAAIGVYRSFAVERAVNGTPAEAHAVAEVWRFVAPETVNWMCKQIAGLMRMKEAVGYANKSGNTELGEVFYFNEFPRQMEEIRKNFRLWY